MKLLTPNITMGNFRLRYNIAEFSTCNSLIFITLHSLLSNTLGNAKIKRITALPLMTLRYFADIIKVQNCRTSPNHTGSVLYSSSICVEIYVKFALT